MCGYYFQFRKINITCHCCGRGGRQNRDEVLYSQPADQIVVLETPEISIDYLVAEYTIDDTEIYTFAMVRDVIMFVAIRAKDSFWILPQDSTIQTNEEMIGVPIRQLISSKLYAFLYRLFCKTLEGDFMMVTATVGTQTRLIRTMPMYDHQSRIIAGTMVVQPYLSVYSEDIKRFVVSDKHVVRRSMCAIGGCHTSVSKNNYHSSMSSSSGTAQSSAQGESPPNQSMR